MSLSAKLRHAPLRLSTGAYILNSGIGKLSADEDSAKGMHGFASGAYPHLQHLDPKTFARALAITEVALGGVLLFPLVPPRVAGAGLVGFSGALLGLYWRTPGMHEPGSPRPTQQGVAIAKDTWMLGIGASLMLDSDGGRSRAKRKARKAELKAARAEHKAELKAAQAEHRAERKAHVKAEVKAAARSRADAARTTAKQRAKAARKLAEETTTAAQPYARAARHAMHSAASTAGDTARSAMATARDAAEAAAGSAAETARSAASAVHG
jgi:hypothetical protein